MTTGKMRRWKRRDRASDDVRGEWADQGHSRTDEVAAAGIPDTMLFSGASRRDFIASRKIALVRVPPAPLSHRHDHSTLRPPFNGHATFIRRKTSVRVNKYGDHGTVSDTRDANGRAGPQRFSRASTRSLAQTSSRLAHWPPPFRGTATKPKIVRHKPDEKPQRAKPRGWRLTRAMFSEFEEE